MSDCQIDVGRDEAMTEEVASAGKADPQGDMQEKIAEMDFETAYARLEEVLAALEEGDLPLEKSLEMYEEGALLAAHCANKLEEAELRVHQWQANNELTTFSEWSDE